MTSPDVAKRRSAGARASGPAHSARWSAGREASRLAHQLERERIPVLERAQELAERPDAHSRRTACMLLAHAFEDDPRGVLSSLADLAADEERAVRSAATAACARIAQSNFERALTGLAVWRDHPSPHVRRAVAAAAARAAKPHRLERAPHLVRLIGPLLADSDPAVRRAVGPGALGSLLSAYPEVAFEALIGWSTSSDPNVLWNVAMAFAAEPAAPLAKRALIVLRKLALDERRAVWRAAAAAMWQLGRRRPDVVRPELDRWVNDEARAKVALEALRYL
jgi:hypothetical protein